MTDPVIYIDVRGEPAPRCVSLSDLTIAVQLNVIDLWSIARINNIRGIWLLESHGPALQPPVRAIDAWWDQQMADIGERMK